MNAFLAISLTAVFLLSTPYCFSDITTGLIGHWKFEEGSGTSAGDSSISANTGTLTNGPLWTSGRIGSYALSFDGSDDYVAVTDSPQAGAFTICGWAYPTAHATNQIILARAHAGGSYDQNYFIFERTPDNVWSFQVSNGGTGNEVKGSAVTLNIWTHVCGVYANASDMRIYVNGALSNTGGNGTAAATALPQTTSIGAYDSQISLWNGNLDEVRIYSRALSVGDIAELYYAGTNIDLHNGLVGWWKLDDGTGTSAADSSGNANTGTLTNGPTWVAGKKGKALSFDGVDDYTATTSSAPLQISAGGSIAFWIKTSGLNNNGQSIFVDNESWPNTGWGILDDGPYASSIKFRTLPGNGTAAFSRSSINDGQWHHIVAVYTGSQNKLYLDSILVDTAASGGFTNNTSGFVIGNFTGSSGGGAMDDVRIYNRALSSDEISALYTWTSRLGSGKIKNAKINF